MWKNVKTHYRIEHIVRVTEKGICIGSSFVHDLIRIKDGKPEWGGIGRPREKDHPLCRYFDEMTADLGKLAELIAAPDTFKKSIPVYTYDGAEIIERFCEEPGWPNVTHEGELMYENVFFAKREDAVAKAKENAKYAVEWRQEKVKERREELARLETELSEMRRIALACGWTPEELAP